MDLICTVPRPHLLGHALIWPSKFSATTLGLFGLYPSSLSKSAGFVSLAGKASLVSISDAILFYNLCWKGSMTADMPSRASYLVYIEWRVNWSKLSQKPVWKLRTTTTNPRVSFIDLYWVFPTNFKIVFYPIQTLWFYWNCTVVLSQTLGYLCFGMSQKQTPQLCLFGNFNLQDLLQLTNHNIQISP